MGRLIATALVIACSTLAVCQPPQGAVEPPDRVADLGCSYETVYYYHQQYSPHAGFEMSFLKLFEAVVENLGGVYDPRFVHDRLASAIGEPRYWKVSTKHLSHDDLQSLVDPFERKSVVKRVVLPKDGDAFTIILDGTLYFGDGYIIAFDAKSFIHDLDRRDAQISTQPGLGLIFHGDPDSSTVTENRLRNRSELSTSTSGIEAELTLLTAKSDGMGGFELDDDGNPKPLTAMGHRVSLEYRYLGLRNLFGAGAKKRISGHSRPVRINDGSLLNLSVEATISTHPLDREATYAITLDTYAVDPNVPGTAAVRQYKVATQQSVHDTTFLMTSGVRWGDFRAHDTGPNAGTFRPFAELKDRFYGEITVDTGYNVLQALKGVPPERHASGWIVRPRIAVGMTPDKSASLQLSGEVSLYYLDPQLGGGVIAAPRIAELMTLSLTHVFNPRTELTLEYEVGFNPDSKFTRKDNLLKLGVTQKF